MANVTVEVPSPLRECILFCEVECVLACCGIDAVSTDSAHVEEWCRAVRPLDVAEARHQLAELIQVVENRSNHVTSAFLNHRTINDAARLELLRFLGAFEAGLSAGAAARATGQPSSTG